MSRPPTERSDARPPVLSPTTTGDEDLAAQIDQALSSRRHVHHERHRSSISLSLFRPSHLRKTESRASSKQGDLARNSGHGIDEGGSEEDEGIEADSDDKRRRRLGRSRRAEVEVPPPIKLLVRKAESAKPIDTDVSGLPLPRAQHVHFPSSDDRPEGSTSQPTPSASPPDGTPEQAHSVNRKPTMPSSKAGDASSGQMVDLLAPRPEERHQAKAEVRKLKKGHTREYVWDGMSKPLFKTITMLAVLILRRFSLVQSFSRTREGTYHACLRDDQRDSLLILPYRSRHSIMFMGTPHFSKSTLFPFDPKAYTVPIHALKPVRAFPTTDRSASADPPPHNTLKSRPFALHRRKRDQGEHLHQQYNKAHAYSELKHTLRRHEHDKKSMTTMYDLHTFQPPSSHWIWLTPWLVNMRQDGVTDERGWEYNYIFRKRGWGPDVGRSGWGGWVRRRMWVRLRSLKMNDDGEEEEDWQDDDDASLDFITDPFDDLGLKGFTAKISP